MISRSGCLEGCIKHSSNYYFELILVNVNYLKVKFNL